MKEKNKRKSNKLQSRPAPRARIQQRAFSVVELLVVIAIIGIITAIAVPALTDMTGETEIAKDKRNAQNVATVYNTAVAAAATPTNLSREDISGAIDALQNGVHGSGFFGESLFLVDITDEEQPGAETYLKLEDGVMSLTGF